MEERRGNKPAYDQVNPADPADDPAGSPLEELRDRFDGGIVATQSTKDGIPTAWVDRGSLVEILGFLKNEIDRPYRMLYDLSAIDERSRSEREGQPDSDFTVVYHLLSFDRNSDIRLKAALHGDDASLPTATGFWQSANWYEREIWDMFGVRFDGHPNLLRILMPRSWEGHPLRKDHPARATEMEPYRVDEETDRREDEDLRFDPEDWGMEGAGHEAGFVYLNVGPQHPGTHGVLRIVLKIEGELITDAVPDIGFHHRGAEKMGERQTWHSYIPYTDRVDYLGGVMNNLPYLLAVENLAGIVVPDRAMVIRVMLCELFRIASHLVWYGTFAQDVGALSPVFYMFNDRERILDIVTAVTGGRMHPGWFRIGGVEADLPRGWDRLVRDFLEYMPERIDLYDKIVLRNRVFRLRTRGIGAYTKEEAIEWGVTGPGLRATGFDWDFRKRRPYSGYENFEFEIPTADRGDCHGRAEVRAEEMRQSLRIIRQCLENMPDGEWKSDHPLATPPRKAHTMHDIETLINHFLGVSWGPVVPAGEAFAGIEATKGNNGYYLISDGDIHPYRVRIRTPSFPHIQMLPKLTTGFLIPDLLAVLGSIDYVLADVDR